MTLTCFYHKNCTDGITAAWCVRREYPNANFIPLWPSQDRVDEKHYKGKDVYFVDVCTEGKLLKKICSKAKSVIILDHHKTYKDILEKFDTKKCKAKVEVVFDMSRAGCQIAWDYIECEVKGQSRSRKKSKNRPFFVNYVADRDLWQFKLKDSKLVNTALYDLGYIKFEKLDELYKIWEKDKHQQLIDDELIPYAKIVDSINEKAIGMAMRYANKAEMKIKKKSYSVWLTSVPGHLKSETCNRLCSKKFKNGKEPDFSINWQHDYPTGQWWISARASKNINLTEVLKDLGGGGHPLAAGFTIPEGKTLKDYFTYQKDE